MATNRSRRTPRKPIASPKKAADLKKMKHSFTEQGGALYYERETEHMRVLFDDGSVVDVHTNRDDSDLRADLLLYMGKERVVGIAVIPRTHEETPDPE